MSSTLTWEPAHRKRHNLPLELKLALQKKFGGTVSDRDMGADYVAYLEGLRDAGVTGAQALIDAIEKHDIVTVTELF